ncbi:MAG TPA: flagellar basal body-associated FliL family protein [Sphingomonas sp.]|nr:flagellar basal body-associated FliL family protein [Sphingomonas sp.]
MSDLVEETAAPKKKKGKKMLFLLIGLVLVGGGTAGGLYAAGVGPFAHPGETIAAMTGPRLVPKSEQKRIGLGSGEGGGAGASKPGTTGGERYASNYYAMEKEFTSNLQDSVHFVQVGIAISTPYDDTVIENIKTNEIAVRSAVLLALSDTSEEQVFSTDGKKQLQDRLTKAINAVLKEKEGFGGVGNVYFTNFIVQ